MARKSPHKNKPHHKKNWNEEEPVEDLIPSKSQLKRDARVVFELARDLVDMSKGQLAALPIDDDLLDDIELARNIRSHVARKRQVQFIAKKMRHGDVSAIRQAQEEIEQAARQTTVRMHRVEAWRDILLKEGDAALSTFLSMLNREVEHSDIQVLRNLLRNARKEAELGKPPMSARKLFKLLREMDTENTLPSLPA